jgi:pyruvate formate lyase activating enzyme
MAWGAIESAHRSTLRQALLQEKVGDSSKGLARCLVCERRCVIAPGARGFCRNRVNIGGKIYVETYGLLSALESRPIEIKPFFHYWPGSTALTFSGWGCNFRCPWCQNFHLSWSSPRIGESIFIEPSGLVDIALRAGDEGVCASFNEPTIHLEYVVDVASEAVRKGLYATIVTNGYMTIHAAKKLVEAGVDGYSIDIKGCRKTYRSLLSADPEHVIRVSRLLREMGAHVEMVFLVVPRANDEPDCVEWVLGRIFDELGWDVPLHVNRYFPANVWREPPTDVRLLEEVASRARSMGFEYVYIGNTGDPRHEETRCPKCGKVLVRRMRYRVVDYRITSDGRCPRCGYKVVLRGRPVLKS